MVTGCNLHQSSSSFYVIIREQGSKTTNFWSSQTSKPSFWSFGETPKTLTGHMNPRNLHVLRILHWCPKLPPKVSSTKTLQSLQNSHLGQTSLRLTCLVSFPTLKGSQHGLSQKKKSKLHYLYIEDQLILYVRLNCNSNQFNTDAIYYSVFLY